MYAKVYQNIYGEICVPIRKTKDGDPIGWLGKNLTVQYTMHSYYDQYRSAVRAIKAKYKVIRKLPPEYMPNVGDGTTLGLFEVIEK